MTKHIHHINLLVRDLESAKGAFEGFLSITPVKEALPLRGAMSYRFNCAGIWLVLVSPINDTSVLNAYLEAHGEGVFLISFESEDLDAELERLTRSNTATPLSGKRRGLSDWWVQDIALNYPLTTVIQLCNLFQNEK